MAEKTKSVSEKDYSRAITALAKFFNMTIEKMKAKASQVSKEVMDEMEERLEWRATGKLTLSQMLKFLNKNQREIGPNNFKIVGDLRNIWFMVIYYSRRDL